MDDTIQVQSGIGAREYFDILSFSLFFCDSRHREKGSEKKGKDNQNCRVAEQRPALVLSRARILDAHSCGSFIVIIVAVPPAQSTFLVGVEAAIFVNFSGGAVETSWGMGPKHHFVILAFEGSASRLALCLTGGTEARRAIR